MNGMKYAIFLLIIIFFSSMRIQAQEAMNVREELPLGVNVILGGPSFAASASLDYFINPVLQVEAGGGLIGYYSGIKLHRTRLKYPNEAIYTGAYYSHLKMKGTGSVVGIYVPLGWEYIFDLGPTYAIELAVWHGFSETTFIWGAVKMGWHF